MVLKFAIVLASLLVLSSSASLSDSLASRFLSSVTKQGNVTIQKDASGFYVNVDFAYQYSDASDSEAYDPAMAAVSLALYTGQTVLTQSCLEFNYYYCSDSSYTCSADTSSTANLYLPYFEVQGYYATADVYLDYSNWQLSNSYQSAVIATQCTGSAYSVGNGRYGLVGLGLNSGSTSNFIGDSTLFSIWLSRDLSTGTLLFSQNTVAASSAVQAGTLYTDSQWNVDYSSIEIQVSEETTSFYGGVIFDINSDAIGFPLNTFSSIITYLSNTNNLYCENVNNYKPYCNYNGKMSDLPTVQITIGSVEISIPPSIYIEDYYTADYSDLSDFNSGFNLNFKAVDSSLSDESYVSPTYENYLILDQNFMSYYYTEFSYLGEEYLITIYQQINNNNPPSPGVPAWPFIVGGVVLLIIVISVVACCCVQRKKRRIRDQAAVSARTDTAPLINNSEVSQAQESALPYHPYNYPPNYNQGNYNYPPQYPNQPYPYANNNWNNVPQNNYPYVPQGQGQFNGNVGGYGQ